MIYSYDDVVSRIQGIIDVKGEDFAYAQVRGTQGPNCLYARDGKPDCIIGHLLFGLGVPIEAMTWGPDTEASRPLASDTIGENFDPLSEDHDIEFSSKARTFLRRLQALQDNGIPWGRAFIDAQIQAKNIHD